MKSLGRGGRGRSAEGRLTIRDRGVNIPPEDGRFAAPTDREVRAAGRMLTKVVDRRQNRGHEVGCGQTHGGQSVAAWPSVPTARAHRPLATPRPLLEAVFVPKTGRTFPMDCAAKRTLIYADRDERRFTPMVDAPRLQWIKPLRWGLGDASGASPLVARWQSA